MSTLVIHPADPTTEFLTHVYDDLCACDVITQSNGLVFPPLLESYERVVFLGHGTPLGLMSVGQFPGSYVIGDKHAHVLRDMPKNIYIWCNADQYVQRHRMISALYTGMFISEMGEAMLMGVDDATVDHIRESNLLFAQAVGEALRNDYTDVLNSVKQEYRELIHSNPVASYNWERLYAN